jgi:hypothetical protein
MAKERDWLDYANLASNLAQNVQLRDLQNKLGMVASTIATAASQQLAFERERQLKQERIEEIRQSVFETMKRLDELEPLLGPEYSGRQMEEFVAFNLQKLGRHIQRKGVEVENVGTYEDKERIYGLYTRLLRLYQTACAHFSPTRNEEVKLAAQCEEEMPDLLRLIGLETLWNRAKPVRAELAPLLEKQRELEAAIQKLWRWDPLRPAPGLDLALLVVMMAVAAYCWFRLWALWAFDGSDDGGWSVAFAVGATLGSVGLFFQFRQAVDTKRAKAELEPIESQISRLRTKAIDLPLRELERLRQRFGRIGLEELERMHGERQALIDGFQRHGWNSGWDRQGPTP